MTSSESKNAASFRSIQHGGRLNLLGGDFPPKTISRYDQSERSSPVNQQMRAAQKVCSTLKEVCNIAVPILSLFVTCAMIGSSAIPILHFL